MSRGPMCQFADRVKNHPRCPNEAEWLVAGTVAVCLTHLIWGKERGSTLYAAPITKAPRPAAAQLSAPAADATVPPDRELLKSDYSSGEAPKGGALSGETTEPSEP